MVVDRNELVAAAEAATIPPPGGPRGLVGSIHRDPALREWVSLESIALPPVAWVQQGQWRLTTLLATPVTGGGSVRIRPPWAALTWSWPTGALIERRRLEPPEHATGWDAQGEPVTLAGPAAEAFWTALEAVLAAPAEAADTSRLGELIGTVLPPAATALYARLVPTLLPPPPPAASGEDGVATRHEPLDQELNQELDRWLTEAIELADRFGLTDITAALRRLRVRTMRPGFRICLLGGSGVGKSHLVNQLIDQEVVPTGVAGTVRVPVSIVAGAPSGLRVQVDGQPPQWRPMEARSWHDLVVPAPANGDLQVRAVVDSAWLRECDVELVDTPGADPVDAAGVDRLAMVDTVLAASDAVVLVVRAPGAFGLAERLFVAEKIRGDARVGLLLVVVSGLDDLREDPAPVLARVRALAAGISPSILVLPGPGAPSGPGVLPGSAGGAAEPTETAEAHVAAIRAALDHIAQQSQRRAGRARQVAALLADECAAMTVLADEGLAAAALDQQARAQARRRLEADLAHGDLAWERIRIELERRRLALIEVLRGRLQAGRDEMVEQLLGQLASQSDPRAFCRQELPAAVRRELSAAATAISSALEVQLAADARWLEQIVATSFGAVPAAGPMPASPSGSTLPGLTGPVDIPRVELGDPRRTNIWVRLGATAGGALVGMGAVAAFGFPPLYTLALVGGGMLGDEAVYRPWLEGQRAKVRPVLRKMVETAIDAHVQAVSDRTRAAYAEVIASTRARQQSWRTGRLAVLDPGPAARPLPWAQLREAATSLREQITQTFPDLDHPG